MKGFTRTKAPLSPNEQILGKDAPADSRNTENEAIMTRIVQEVKTEKAQNDQSKKNNNPKNSPKNKR
jgi:hypothetical protein